MKLKFLVLALLAAGTIATHGDNKKIDREQKHPNVRSSRKPDCNESSTSPPSALSPSTSAPETTTSQPCDWCRNQPITITDTWAGHCFPDGQGPTCDCLCGDVFCSNGETIDRSTCTPDGRLQDCRCISSSTVAPTTEPPTTVSPTTVPPTTDPFVGCEWCLNEKLSVGDTFAGHCFPNTSEGECNCLCADLFCQDGQIIDRTTCVNGGSLADCRCIDAFASTTTSSPMPEPTTGFQ